MSAAPSLVSGPTAKWQRVLRALVERPSLNRFEAERDPRIHDHTLNTSIHQLGQRGLIIDRELIDVPGYQGARAHIASYKLAPSSRARALELLGTST